MSKKDKKFLHIKIITFFLRKHIFFIIICLTSLFFVLIRVDHLAERLTVGTDQGMHLLEMYQIFKLHTWTLLGPASSFTTGGRQFFFGPLTYYFALPVFALSSWNTLAVSYFLIFVQLAGFLVSFFVIYKLINRKMAFYFLAFGALTPIVVNYSRFLWNPNLMIPTSCILLAVLLVTLFASQNRIWFLGIGILFGFGLQFHYAYILAIIVTFLILIIKKKLTFARLLIISIGFSVGFFPLIIFELRHGFYNFNTILLFVQSQIEKKSLTPPAGYFPEYYLLYLVPFILLAFAYAFGRFVLINRIGAIVVAVIFIFVSMRMLLPVSTNGFLSADDWNYPTIEHVRDIVVSEHRDKYNLVDVLTGDTRAMYLRALLTISGETPMSVDAYPNARFLYIYSRLPIEQIIGGQLWEVSVIKPVKLLKQWHIKKDINLYLVERVSKD